MKRLAAVLIGIALVAPSAARANDDVLDAASEARFKEGLAFAKQGKYEQARASFLQTLVLSPGNASVLLNLAISEHGAGHLVEALGHLKMYLASAKVDPKKAHEVKQTLYEELWRATGHLRIAADRGDAVALDGVVKLGNAPLADVVDVAAGKHRVAAGARSVDVTVSAGETKDVLVTEQPPVAAASRAGPSPGASGRPEVANGRPETPTREDASRGSPARWIVPVGLGVVAASALAIGVGFASANKTAIDEADKLRNGAGGRPCADRSSTVCGSYEDALATASTDQTLSYIGYTAAGVAAAGAIATIVFWPRDSAATSAARILPSIGPHAATLQLHVGF